ncbi:putative ribonuclease H-like superfamily [Helianthus anomalus]
MSRSGFRTDEPVGSINSYRRTMLICKKVTINSKPTMKPPPVESTSFKLVQDVKDLKELAAKLRDANEFAVDLEHNHYRSFQGLTCLELIRILYGCDVTLVYMSAICLILDSV